MKDYINLFHSMISEVHYWNISDRSKKIEIINSFLDDYGNIEELIDYFDEFNMILSKNTLNSYLKSVSNQ